MKFNAEAKYNERFMLGFVAVTDPGWFEHLSRTPGPKDANFWRPSSRTFRLDLGTPFLFKLKAPHHAIGGFGYFAGFTILPDWLAWETFGESNGVASLTDLRSRISAIQGGARIQADPSGRIGCCLVAETFLFARSAWIAPPNDWSPRTQTGARYNLGHGEGQRVWRECIARAAASSVDVLRVSEICERYGSTAFYTPRLGQGIFRVRVLDAYARACAVTREHSLPVLEAAHIVPFSNGGEHAVANGLLLRSDLHRLFDRGYVTVDGEGRFVVGKRLKEEFENGRSYYSLHGLAVGQPSQRDLRPTPAALAFHRDRVFLG